MRHVIASLLLGLLLLGCAATGPPYRPSEPTDALQARLVVYRISQVGGALGTWVPTKLEIDGKVVGRIPDQSFMAFDVPLGEVALSATDMVGLRYADEHRMTLRGRFVQGEIAYFRLTSVYGASCPPAAQGDAGTGEVAHVTHRFRPDSAQTSCFQRVPAGVALKELKPLRRAD
jgi:hypothetical protein